MTIQDIITRTRQIVAETDPNNSHASDSVILGWVNACTLQLCSTLSTLPKKLITTETVADTVTLDSSLLRLDYIAISDNASTPTYFPLTTTDFNNFSRQTSQWENQPDGKPTTFVRMNDTDWMMWPPPDATWTGKPLHIVGSVLPDDKTSTSDSPPVSLALHVCYPHYCAWLFFLLLNNPERAAGEFAAYDALRRLNLQTATSTTGTQQAFRVRM